MTIPNKHCTLDRLTCYTLSLLLTLGLVAVIVVVVIADNDATSNRAEIREGVVWYYECTNSQCVKQLIREDIAEPMGLQQCRSTCNHTGGLDLWPLPTGTVETNAAISLSQINSNALRFRSVNVNSGSDFWEVNQERLLRQIRAKMPNDTIPNGNAEVYSVQIDIIVESNDVKLYIQVDETYTLSVNLVGGDIVARIESNTIFGARHALESLAQLIIYDDVTNRLLVRHEIRFSDGPVYHHRGVSLDTSRNYFSVENIKRLIDGLAMVKLNRLHWHITDTNSFPLVIASRPFLHQYGAYSPKEIYTSENVKDIVKYAYNRGIYVLPELDAPAHIGEGWQFTDLLTCFNIQPWADYCYQAPCGQVDPTKDLTYDILEDIYREMLDMYGHNEMFHMGGDEVKHECWATSESLKQWMLDQGWGLEVDDYMRLWNYFQTEALKRLDAVSFVRADKIVLWSSSLTTGQNTDYLDPDRYVIQFWETKNHPMLQELLGKGYEIIVTNSDVLYMDCGYEAWIGLGNNWCSPYHGWHEIYNQDYKQMGGALHQGIIGAEAALFAEQADDQTMDGRYFPRVIALAERLWSDPITDYRAAEPRLLMQRERIVENGLRSEAIQPKWCRQNEGQCPYWG